MGCSFLIFLSSLTFSPEKYLKRLLGKNNIEDSLKRLDSLTHDEARMATAEALKTTRSVNNKMKVVLDGAQSVVMSRLGLPER